MHILFAHQNFPAQFGGFGAWLAQRGWEVTFVTAAEAAKPPPKCRLIRVKPHREASEKTHRFAQPFERAMINAQAFANAAIHARDQGGLRPDIVVAHSGWGTGSFARAVWPDCRFVAYAEWFYRWPPTDRGAEFTDDTPEDSRARAMSRNAPLLLDLAHADLILCPTEFQASQLPDAFRTTVDVAHDGVEIDRLLKEAPARLPVSLPKDAEVLTYATRGMEPQRGFPDALRAIARLQAQRPNLHALIGGQDRVVYGAQLPEGQSWKARMLDELDLDPARTHFTGLLPRADFFGMLRASHVHVYLTLPFVLSWSLIDAMAAGAPLVVSDTAPVREALTGGHDARMVSFGDPDALVTEVSAVLDDPSLAKRLGRAAAQTARARYDAAALWPEREAVLRALV